MARSSTTLTEAWLDRPQKSGLYWCKQNPGLGCRVGKSGSKAWVFQRSGGARITLGRWPEFGLRAARDRAADLAARGRSSRADTLSQALEHWAQRALANGASEATVENRRRQFRKHLGDQMDRPLTSWTKRQVSALQLEIAKSSVHAANDILRHWGTMHRAVSDDPWPGEGIGGLKPPSSKRRVIDPDTWWSEIQRAESPVVRGYWRFVALTGLRENDVKTARHDNLRNGWLYLPEPKGGAEKAFDLPLSNQALAVVRDMPRMGEWIFPGQSGHIVNPKPPSIRHLCSEHALRHFWRYVAEVEAGCPFPIVMRLMNHSEKRSTTDLYGHRNIAPDIVADWAQRIANTVEAKLSL
ncbi:MAG: hypothetical protein VR74_17500 [Hyphomonas sp. BRH_c22]|uniref:tyrosine-type recombinase/integrase n=1 Tax=Hyphomonas sp. BRH_c22 TaxID=1629710 RepID=UPI0005F1AFBE|nr:site-specific integrase [Hyphomonas sp. BRH_c22]KJS35158.1 MAG: hypothetical protein VR74_17500 [Hyphomonas sp. BRH_c22]